MERFHVVDGDRFIQRMRELDTPISRLALAAFLTGRNAGWFAREVGVFPSPGLRRYLDGSEMPADDQADLGSAR